MGDEETAIGKKIGEEEKRRDDRVTWDGHTSSVEAATRAARAHITLEDQIQQIHKVLLCLTCSYYWIFYFVLGFRFQLSSELGIPNHIPMAPFTLEPLSWLYGIAVMVLAKGSFP